MKPKFVFALLLVLSTAGLSAQEKNATDDPLAKYRDQATQKWESEIAKLEQRDRTEVDPKDPILFIGSSSIRLWKTLADDMAPRTVINRGYGGAKFSDLAVFVDRIINAHKFKALVIFVANDIVGKEDDKSPEEVVRLFKYIVGQVRETHTTEPIFLIAITPTPSRFKAWPEIQKANAALKKTCDADPSLHFIATEKQYLDPEGEPIPAYFVKDMLHQNEEGYKLWSSIVRESIDKVLKSTAAAN